MPNTLVHLCIQTPASRLAIRDVDFKWIALACIIPDIPWILQRIITPVLQGNNLIDLRIYVIVQASLIFCLLLSLAMSLVTDHPRRIFLLLAFNSSLHLFLDALQIKWGNGVHFLAPFSWRVTNLSYLWPEDKIIYILSCLGFAVLLFWGLKDQQQKIGWGESKRNKVLAVVLLVTYFAAPFFFFNGPEKANNHYVATLREVNERKGEKIEFDRRQFRRSDKTIHAFSGERLGLIGGVPAEDALLSIQGYFVGPESIRVTALHAHSHFRDIASMIGLAGVFLVWFFAIIRKKSSLEPSR